eukprot:gene4078-biopygen12393
MVPFPHPEHDFRSHPEQALLHPSSRHVDMQPTVVCLEATFVQIPDDVQEGHVGVQLRASSNDEDRVQTDVDGCDSPNGRGSGDQDGVLSKSC